MSFKRAIIYDNENTINIYNNLEIDEMTEPLIIKREEIEISEDKQYSKYKSKVVEYIDEDYKQLKLKESLPYIISDRKGKQLSGKLQNIVGDTSMYFVLTETKSNNIDSNNLNRNMNNTGSFILMPVNKWYSFTKRNSNLGNEKATENLERNLKTEIYNDSEDSKDQELDFEEKFDDDDDETDRIMTLNKEKKLDTSGEKILKLVNELSSKKSLYTSNVKNNSDDKITGGGADETKRQKKELNDVFLKKLLNKGRMTISEMIKIIRSEFTVGEVEKKVIKSFLQVKCKFETDKKTGEKFFKLK